MSNTSNLCKNSFNVGTTTGLVRYSSAEPLHAEQVYLDRITPIDIPHPDGGSLTPRTLLIRRGRGYEFKGVLELTEQQAIELAHLILNVTGEQS